ncbi:MAG: YdbL family probable chaperone protein, partial [Planctomycetota bacterium]
MMRIIRTCVGLLLASGLLLACGCNVLEGLVGTEIAVKGGQRSLEEQVLGSFEHIGEEVYLLAGVRAVDPVSGVPTPPRPMTPSEQRALAARRRMEFNRDDVLAFKAEGYVGEGNDGLLAQFDERLQDLKAADPRRFELVREIVAEENEDRLIVMQRIVDTSPALHG